MDVDRRPSRASMLGRRKDFVLFPGHRSVYLNFSTVSQLGPNTTCTGFSEVLLYTVGV